MLRTILLVVVFLLNINCVSSQDFQVSQETQSGMLTVTSEKQLRHNRNRTVDSRYIRRVLNDSVKFKNVDIFLISVKREDDIFLNYKKNLGIKSAENYFKKVNDSLYEIYIIDPAKEVLFAQKNSSFFYSWVGSMSGGLNSPDAMGGLYDSLIIITNEKREAFDIIPFNPFLYGLELRIGDEREGRNIVSFKILFQFPKPKLIGLTNDSLMINKKKQNPSMEWSAIYTDSLDLLKNETVLFKKNESLVFFFAHFGGYFRRNYMDNLLYKLDDAADWTLTPLANTPSILLENLPVGKHKLYVKYPAEKAAIFTYEFEVVASVWDSRIWDVLIGFLVAATVLLIFFKIRLRNAKQKAQKTKLELQSIQAQLNPHFMFNALGSIQYLMNNNEKQKADHYLTEFGGLLRNSLSNNEKEMIPLSVELDALQTYIHLEKLRFNFQFTINIDDNIQQENISVPSLLFQPLIENAIKHGISVLKEKGVLTLNVSQVANNLVFEIVDNGAGFDTNKIHNGCGVRLAQERIKILNKQGFEIELNFISNQKDKTTAALVFKNWV